MHSSDNFSNAKRPTTWNNIGWSWWWQFFKRKQQNDEDKWWWELFKWNNKGIGCSQHTCFYPPQFRQGSPWRRQRQASHSFKITHLIVFELHFFIPTRSQGPCRPGRPPQQHRQSLRKREGTAAAAFLWKFPTRISSPDPQRPGKGRRRCLPWDICQLLGVPEKFWFLNFQVHNYPYMAIMDQ